MVVEELEWFKYYKYTCFIINMFCLTKHDVLLFKSSLKKRNKLIVLFSKDTLNVSNVTVKTFTLLQNISISNKCCSFKLFNPEFFLLLFPRKYSAA